MRFVPQAFHALIIIGEMEKKAECKDSFTVRRATWLADSAALAAIRREVFVVEQQVPESEEWDDRDAVSAHVLSVTRDGVAVRLTPTEWGVLLALAAQPGRVCSRYELINRVRGYEFDGYERTVDSHVKNLRRKIEADPARPVVVQTVTGVGYRMGLDRDR